MNRGPTVDPELAKLVEWMRLGNLTHDTLDSIRTYLRPDPRLFDLRLKPTEVWTSSQPCVRLLVYNPPTPLRNRPAILHFHGGGLICGSADMSKVNMPAIALEHDAVIVSVDYRLAPENPFPAALDDASAALRWLRDNSGKLGVDPSRIVLMGESAGGGIAAALSLMIRDTGDTPVAAQFLVYPMLDHRTGHVQSTIANDDIGDLVWTTQNNRFSWDCYRGRYSVDDERASWFSPALAEQYEDLPSTFIAVGTLDLFAKENLAFAAELMRAGAEVQFHLLAGAVHGFDMARRSGIAREFAQMFSNALTRAFKRLRPAE